MNKNMNDNYTENNERIGNYQTPQTGVDLFGMVNKISHQIEYAKGQNYIVKKGQECFYGDFQIDEYVSIGFFPNCEFEITRIIIKESEIDSEKEDDYFEVYAAKGMPPDDYGQLEIPSVLSFTFILNRDSYSKIKQELNEKDNISNKKLRVKITLDSTGIYENFIAYMSGDHSSKELTGPYYKILISKNDVAEFSDDFKKSHKDSDYQKCKRPFSITVITNE